MSKTVANTHMSPVVQSYNFCIHFTYLFFYLLLRGECVDNGRCTAVAAAAAAHATGELAVTPPLPPPGTEMVTVAPGSLETHGAIRPSASPNQK